MLTLKSVDAELNTAPKYLDAAKTVYQVQRNVERFGRRNISTVHAAIQGLKTQSHPEFLAPLKDVKVTLFFF